MNILSKKAKIGNAAGEFTIPKIEAVQYQFDTVCFRQSQELEEYVSASFRLAFEGKGFHGELRRFQKREIIYVVCYSLPALIHGHNLTPVDTNTALSALSTRVNKQIGHLIVSELFDAKSATVTDADANIDWRLSAELKAEYIELLSRYSAPRMSRKCEPEDTLFPTTIRFYNGSREIQFYDKESKHPDIELAKGILRCEVNLQGYWLKKFVKGCFGFNDRTASKILTPEFAAFAVEEMLKSAKLTDRFLSLADYKRIARRTLKRKHPRMRPETIKRILSIVTDATRLDLAEAREIHGSKQVDYAKKILHKLGLWRLTFSRLTLPAFPLPDNKSVLNPHSNTDL